MEALLIETFIEAEATKACLTYMAPMGQSVQWYGVKARLYCSEALAAVEEE